MIQKGEKPPEKRVVVKVIDELFDRLDWMHFCYMDKKLYYLFLETCKITSADLNEVLYEWSKEDFNTKFEMSTRSDILILKDLIDDYYKATYPHIHISGVVDRQGWSRVWFTNKIIRKLKRLGVEYLDNGKVKIHGKK